MIFDMMLRPNKLVTNIFGSTTNTEVLRNIKEGIPYKDYVCTHAGTSQYSDGFSSSACGLVSMNFIQHILTLEVDGMTGDALAARMTQKEFLDEIMSISTFWPSDAHLEVDELHKTPFYNAALHHVHTSFGKAGKEMFKHIIKRMDSYCYPQDDKPRSCAIAITRPPEIVSCLKITHPKRDFIVILDSHSRPSHPNGAAIIFCESASSAAQYLADLFKVDESLFAPDSGLQWQAELLGHVSGHFFVSSRRDMRMAFDASLVMRETNCSLLLEKNRVKELESQNKHQETEIVRLQDSNKRLEEQLTAARAEKTGIQDETQKLKNYIAQLEEGFQTVSYGQTSKSRKTMNSKNSSGLQSQTTRRSPSPAYIGSGVSSFSSSLKKEVRPDTSAKGKRKISDLELALLMQNEFDNEDKQLAAQMQQLLEVKQATFDCGICFDQLPLDDAARLQGCQHIFCRECIRGYITSKLNEKKYPIPCPMCATNKDGNTASGRIDETLIHQIGITESAYRTFNELQVTKFSVSMDCKRCGQSAFIDKEEFQKSKIIHCPFPNCGYSWCKDCQQEYTLSENSFVHSCDGSEEIEQLMNTKGWKHCPGCRTPTEKTEGCNHMTCPSPGCNSHFCYRCGQLIVASNDKRSIDNAIQTHYSTCKLFQYDFLQ